MRYDDPELIRQLAGAYVLGTLRGGARRRFERLAQDSMAIREAIWTWERRLVPLAEGPEPVQPSKEVWSAIERRLFAPASTPARRGRAGWWQALSAALAVALVVAIGLPLLQQPPVQDPLTEKLALIQDEGQQPLWVVAVDSETGTLYSRAVSAPAREADRVFELWMLPAQGQPRSFGLLPTDDAGRVRRSLSPALVALLADAQGLAVSIEPPGGSPTGVPTGPVVFSAPILSL